MILIKLYSSYTFKLKIIKEDIWYIFLGKC